jgi:hypothetical protein
MARASWSLDASQSIPPLRDYGAIQPVRAAIYVNVNKSLGRTELLARF